MAELDELFGLLGCLVGLAWLVGLAMLAAMAHLQILPATGLLPTNNNGIALRLECYKAGSFEGLAGMAALAVSGLAGWSNGLGAGWVAGLAGDVWTGYVAGLAGCLAWWKLTNC